MRKNMNGTYEDPNEDVQIEFVFTAYVNILQRPTDKNIARSVEI